MLTEKENMFYTEEKFELVETTSERWTNENGWKKKQVSEFQKQSCSVKTLSITLSVQGGSIWWSNNWKRHTERKDQICILNLNHRLLLNDGNMTCLLCLTTMDNLTQNLKLVFSFRSFLESQPTGCKHSQNRTRCSLRLMLAARLYMLVLTCWCRSCSEAASATCVLYL